jgi:hypothetical protein
MHVCVVKSAKYKQEAQRQGRDGRELPSFYAIMAPNELKCTCSEFYFIILCILILHTQSERHAACRSAPINLGCTRQILKLCIMANATLPCCFYLKSTKTTVNALIYSSGCRPLHAIKGLRRSYFYIICMRLWPLQRLEKHPCVSSKISMS